MADKKYLYEGPLNAITVPSVKGGEPPKEIALHNGKTYLLPEAHPQVAALVANGFLTTVVPVVLEQPAAVPVKTRKENPTDAS